MKSKFEMAKIQFITDKIDTSTPDINLTKSAEEKLKKVFANKQNSFFKIDLKEGGCKGMKYAFSVVDSTEDNDVVIKKEYCNLAISSDNLKYINNSTLDYVESLTESSFKLKFDSTLDLCSCGGSFSI